jgi:hypothetical protein
MPAIIKAKAWDTKRKKMYSAAELGSDELQLHPNGSGFFNASSVSPRMSQYYPHLLPLLWTGMNDKNGVGIYDGDVIRHFGVVEWYISEKEGFFGFCFRDKKGERHDMGYLLCEKENMGSIHEDPTLLERMDEDGKE